MRHYKLPLYKENIQTPSLYFTYFISRLGSKIRSSSENIPNRAELSDSKKAFSNSCCKQDDPSTQFNSRNYKSTVQDNVNSKCSKQTTCKFERRFNQQLYTQSLFKIRTQRIAAKENAILRELHKAKCSIAINYRFMHTSAVKLTKPNFPWNTRRNWETKTNSHIERIPFAGKAPRKLKEQKCSHSFQCFIENLLRKVRALKSTACDKLKFEFTR